MAKPKRPSSNRARERRIEQEIIVDAYTSDERAMSWYYYLEGKLAFPFKAKCVAEPAVSPFKKGEVVEVLGIAPEEDCMSGMFVLVRLAGRKVGVPLAQLAPLDTDGSAREAIQDWRYWTAMGYEF
jgi:Calcium binding